MVIKVDSELENALKERARRQGVDPEVLAVQTLRDQFLTPAPGDASRDEWERRLRGVATDCGVSLSDSALSREAMYE